MADLSHWDFAERFGGREAAMLVAGRDPSTEESWIGVTPIYDRMESAYRDAGEDISRISKIGPKGVEIGSFNPTSLHSELMVKAFGSKSYFHFYDFKTGFPDFENVFFPRSEIVRWLAAIGLKSAYQFAKPFDQDARPSLVISSATTMASPLDDVAEEFRQWLIMDTWPYEAAMWLIAGVIPREIYEGFGFHTTDFRLLHNDRGEKDEKIHQIGNLKRLWLSNPENPSRAAPAIFVKWAEEKGYAIDWLEPARREGFLLEKVASEDTQKMPPDDPDNEGVAGDNFDPADLPDELYMANLAFRAVTNGYGEQSDTFRNRLISYLKLTYPNLKNDPLQRIATVANPDKSTGRKRRSPE